MNEEILVKFPPVNTITDFTSFRKELALKLKGRVKEAWVFGSFARGEQTEKSDLDLILVVDTRRPYFERILDFTDIQTGENEMDLLVYTPAEFASMKEKSDGGFWKKVFDEMIRIV